MNKDNRLLISKVMAALRKRDGQTDLELTISVYGSYTHAKHSAIHGECNYQARGRLILRKKVQGMFRNYIKSEDF